MAPRLPHLAHLGRRSRRSRPSTATRGALIASTAVLAALGLSAASAQAGTVSVSETMYGKGFELPRHVVYTAAANERNHLSVTWAAYKPADGPTPATPQSWTVTDKGAPVTAGAGCIQIDPQSATCPLITSDIPVVNLADGDDEFISDTAARVYGGEDDDTIRFTDDTGWSGSFVSGGAGDDLIDGALVTRLVADGGDGGDLLIGSTGADDLIGGHGVDELRGGNGDDRLAGNGGRDSIACGADDDTATLDLSDRLIDPDAPTARAQVSDPTAADGDADQVNFKTDCENVELPTGGNRVGRIALADETARLRDGVLTLGARTGPRRSYVVQLRSPAGKLLGTGTLKTKTIKIRLTTEGLAELEQSGRHTVRLLTRPAGAKGAGAKSKPGVQLDLTIGT